MKIGVISDTHGDTKAWLGAIEIFEGAQYILHGGDVLYHGVFNPILSTYNGKKLAEMINECPIPLIFSRGNCDADVDQVALKYPIASLITETDIDGMKILVHHGDKNDNKELAKNYKPKIIVSGHTHLYGIEKYRDTIFLNPGSPSLPKNDKNIPTVATIEDGVIRIFNIENKEILVSESI